MLPGDFVTPKHLIGVALFDADSIRFEERHDKITDMRSIWSRGMLRHGQVALCVCAGHEMTLIFASNRLGWVYTRSIHEL